MAPGPCPSELILKYVIMANKRVNAIPIIIVVISRLVVVGVPEGSLLPKIFLVIPSLFLGESQYTMVESAAQFVRMDFGSRVQEFRRVRRFEQ